MADQAEYLVIVYLHRNVKMKMDSDSPHQLQTNLRNVENTFGKSSNQYLDVLEVIENYMDNMETTPKAPEPESSQTASPPSFTNLTFRPKKQL